MPNQNDQWFLRAASSGAIKAVFYKITLVYLIPIGTPIMTAALGFTQGLPWMYVALGAMAAFAFTTNGLLRFDEWRLRRRVADKLAFSSVIFGRSINGDGVTLGVRLISYAQFPIEFDIKRISTRISNIVPRETRFNVTRFLIPPNGIGFFNDHVISIDNPPKPGTLEGFVEYEIDYGQVGLLKYHLSGKKQAIVSFNEEGTLVHGTWNDAV